MNHINIHWNEKLEPRSPPFQVSALTSKIEIHARSCFFSLAKWISKCFFQSETALAGGTENFSMERWVGRATLGDLSRLWKTLPEAGWAGGDSRGNLCPLSLPSKGKVPSPEGKGGFSPHWATRGCTAEVYASSTGLPSPSPRRGHLMRAVYGTGMEKWAPVPPSAA